MIYSSLRWITGIALHWFYSDIRTVGRSRIPMDGPLLIAANHQNALVDSLIVGWLVPRRVVMTAKATLSDNAIIAVLFRILRVIPLRRTRDEMERTASVPERGRNEQAFREVLLWLEKKSAVLIFPEGRSHNDRKLGPLKTGLARLALQACVERKISGVRILPVGLVFEDKGIPGTAVGVRFGEAIEMDTWPGEDCLELTKEIAARLRAISEGIDLPARQTEIGRKADSSVRKALIAGAAYWGRISHELPLNLARRIAIHRSTDADQPAMLTILFGISLVILTYAVHVTVIILLLHSLIFATVYLLSLLCGAYWAAFQQHRERS